MKSEKTMKGENTMIKKPGFRRIFTCILTVLMLMVLVTGCGNSTTPGTDVPQTNTNDPADTPDKQEKPAEIVMALCADNSPRTADAPLIEDAINDITLDKINTKYHCSSFHTQAMINRLH